MNSPETIDEFDKRLLELTRLTGATYSNAQIQRCLGGWVLVVDRRRDMNVSIYPPEISARIVLHTV